MKISQLSLHPYNIHLTNGKLRKGAIVKIVNELNQEGFGDIAPLPSFSYESLEDSLKSIEQNRKTLLKIDWTAENSLEKLKVLKLFPSASFGLESAILSLVAPTPKFKIQSSALLMGTPDEILELANLRAKEGFTTAKLKVSNLQFDEARNVIHKLKNVFRLRIDVNRAWSTKDSLHFFSEFPLNAFDYVEEPFENPGDLGKFLHPLAVDESYPNDLNLKQLEQLPSLKALIYKPTIQGGMVNCLSLYDWTKDRGIQFVLSSSFESDVGLRNLASMAYRLALPTPIGIGTYHYLNDHLSDTSIRFEGSSLIVQHSLTANQKLLHFSFLKEVCNE